MNFPSRKKFNNVRMAIAIFAVAILAFAICGVGICDENVASAYQYAGVEASSLWYYGSQALDVEGAKSIVNGWNKSFLSPVTIAVIDTGIDAAHEIFDGVLYTNESGEVEGYNSYAGQVVGASALADRTSGRHGNGVAGVIAMLINELGLKGYVKIYPIKANNVTNGADAETFSIDSITRAVRKAKDMNVDIINLSLGTLYSASSDWATNKNLLYAISEANETAMIVAAAGNNGKDSTLLANRYFPAALDGVYSVMALSKTGSVTSNYGEYYDVAAPGEDIYTAYMTDTYHKLSGTSMAAPFASMAAALLKLRYQAERKQALYGSRLDLYMRNVAFNTIVYSGHTIKCLDFRTVLEQNFESTQIAYDSPTSISINHDGTLGRGTYANAIYMQAVNVKKITFIARINPYGKTDPDLNGIVEWYLCDSYGAETLLGKGLKLEYTAKVFGDTDIIARLRYGDNNLETRQSLHIEFAPYLVGDVCVTYAKQSSKNIDEVPHGGVIYTNEATLFALTGIEYCDTEVLIKWYVDGKYVANGRVFAYTPKKTGKHTISAQYGDNPRLTMTNVFEADVKPFILRPLDMSMLIIGLLIVIAIAIAAGVIIKRKRASKPDECVEQEENTEK